MKWLGIETMRRQNLWRLRFSLAANQLARLIFSRFASILFSNIVGRYAVGETGDRAGPAERPFTVGDMIPGFIADFLTQLIRIGLSIDPDARPSFHDIMA
jgi:hypothetical protein